MTLDLQWPLGVIWRPRKGRSIPATAGLLVKLEPMFALCSAQRRVGPLSTPLLGNGYTDFDAVWSFWCLALPGVRPVSLRRNHDLTYRRLQQCSNATDDRRQTDNTVTMPTHWLASHESAKTTLQSTLSPSSHYFGDVCICRPKFINVTLRVTLKFRGLRVEIAFKMLNFENNRSLKIRIKSGMRLTKLIPAAFFSTWWHASGQLNQDSARRKAPS